MKAYWNPLKSMFGKIGASPIKSSKIIVGLGNPGSQYSKTRHNAGFWCVELLAQENSIGFSTRRRQAMIGEGEIGKFSVVLAKPRTLMNNNGAAVEYLLTRYRSSPQDLIIIYDDLSLPIGTFRIRARGGSGGHNGMKSVIASTKTQEISRIRIGIGNPPDEMDQIKYVLGQMSKEEQNQTSTILEKAVRAATCMLTDGVCTAMNRFN